MKKEDFNKKVADLTVGEFLSIAHKAAIVERKEFLSVEEVAELTGYAAITIYTKNAAGEMPSGIKITAGKLVFRTDEIIEWINKTATPKEK